MSLRLRVKTSLLLSVLCLSGALTARETPDPNSFMDIQQSQQRLNQQLDSLDRSEKVAQGWIKTARVTGKVVGISAGLSTMALCGSFYLGLPALMLLYDAPGQRPLYAQIIGILMAAPMFAVMEYKWKCLYPFLAGGVVAGGSLTIGTVINWWRNTFSKQTLRDLAQQNKAKFTAFGGDSMLTDETQKAQLVALVEKQKPINTRIESCGLTFKKKFLVVSKDIYKDKLGNHDESTLKTIKDSNAYKLLTSVQIKK